MRVLTVSPLLVLALGVLITGALAGEPPVPIEGKLLIDIDDRTIELGPRQGFTVPRGVEHRTRAPDRTVIMMFEGAGVVPTGD